ncbi:hypothetical protein V1280_002983 [Bradyrhizobium sp. AZCC 2230]
MVSNEATRPSVTQYTGFITHLTRLKHAAAMAGRKAYDKSRSLTNESSFAWLKFENCAWGKVPQ